MRRAIPRVLRTINAKWALQYLRFLFHRTAILVSNRKDGILPLGKQQVNRVESTIVRLQLIADPGWIAGKQEVIGIGEFLTPLDPKLRIRSDLGAIRVR
jgi:hypothetical protein